MGQVMDSMGGIEVPDVLPKKSYIDISNEDYQKIMKRFDSSPVKNAYFKISDKPEISDDELLRMISND